MRPEAGLAGREARRGRAVHNGKKGSVEMRQHFHRETTTGSSPREPAIGRQIQGAPLALRRALQA